MNIKYHSGLLVAFILLSTAIYGLLGPGTQKTLGIERNTVAELSNWSYEADNGPNEWASIDSKFSKCELGMEQSPIDIGQVNRRLDNSNDFEMKYKPTTFTLNNNGHTIQAKDSSGDNFLVIGGDAYKLVQMHFHNPSEHQINGQSFDMEGHLVHTNGEGKLAILGFLIREGSENIVLTELWSKLPQKTNSQEVPLSNSVDLANLFPEKRMFFNMKAH